jgi:hypothetical protein
MQKRTSDKEDYRNNDSSTNLPVLKVFGVENFFPDAVADSNIERREIMPPVPLIPDKGTYKYHIFSSPCLRLLSSSLSNGSALRLLFS